jgi:leader peptidase (prepilin peptidase)/N-methyltransferase
VPLFSWLSLRGTCRYCHKKLPVMLPVAELTGAVAFSSSYILWPVHLSGVLPIAQFAVWCLGLVLLLILFFYDLQWFILPNKVVHPLWGLAALFWLLQFAQKPTLATVINGLFAVVIAGGLFLAFYIISSGKWIGFGDVRLGLAIGLFVGKPILAGLVLFAASVTGILFSLPSLLSGTRKLTSKVPFGPLLIIGLIFSMLVGQRLVDWYMLHILYL